MSIYYLDRNKEKTNKENILLEIVSDYLEGIYIVTEIVKDNDYTYKPINVLSSCTVNGSTIITYETRKEKEVPYKVLSGYNRKWISPEYVENCADKLRNLKIQRLEDDINIISKKINSLHMSTDRHDIMLESLLRESRREKLLELDEIRGTNSHFSIDNLEIL